MVLFTNDITGETLTQKAYEKTKDEFLSRNYITAGMLHCFEAWHKVTQRTDADIGEGMKHS